ncbi:protein of unknown function [Candidatus Nitrosocaldus cavascurensis]|uniref:Uncharacterized protein n=1 Tax=Candidatus Nitrosocaldus cavascurensis TaxID=2058097 RepID=A0A2K5ARN0_9ARCH|nr:protein of unknown function [Candidatus Nitrosocaldus cavascurensis]
MDIVRNKYGREPMRKILIISSVKKEIADLITDKARKSCIELGREMITMHNNDDYIRRNFH